MYSILMLWFVQNMTNWTKQSMLILWLIGLFMWCRANQADTICAFRGIDSGKYEHALSFGSLLCHRFIRHRLVNGQTRVLRCSYTGNRRSGRFRSHLKQPRVFQENRIFHFGSKYPMEKICDWTSGIDDNNLSIGRNPIRESNDHFKVETIFSCYSFRFRSKFEVWNILKRALEVWEHQFCIELSAEPTTIRNSNAREKKTIFETNDLRYRDRAESKGYYVWWTNKSSCRDLRTHTHMPHCAA